MSEKEIMNLYELLPAIYRLRDAEQGYKLRALLEIISDQADILKRDIDGLWDDLFIETCRGWVIPYLGDLVANNPLHEVATRRRADVAKTIYYRRRKGTLSMLEELARDVTGWGAHAVAFFEQLGWTQNLNHLRYQATVNPTENENSPDPHAVDRVGSANLRNRNVLDQIDSPFDVISHTVDVRAISRWEGWYNIRKIGFFLWRLRSYPMTDVHPRRSSSSKFEFRFHFSPLGNPSPLFNRPDPELGEDGLCTEINMPGPIRPLAFYFSKEKYYSPVDAEDFPQSKKSIAIYCGPDINSASLVPMDKVVCKDLSNWGPPPEGMMAAIDLRLGRITFAKEVFTSNPVEVSVCYNYGFSADIGGGPYERRNSLADEENYDWEITVCKHIDPSDKTTKCSASSLEQALKDWADPAEGKGKGNKRSAIITIADSSTYEETVSEIVLPEGKSLVIQAANQARPHIRLIGNYNLPGILKIKGNSGSELVLNGLLIEGGIRLDEKVKDVTIAHCTLVPGLSLGEEGQPLFPDRPSVSVEKSNRWLSLILDQSITGSLILPAAVECLTVRDSIIDACNYISVNEMMVPVDKCAISFGEAILQPGTLPLQSWGSYEAASFRGWNYFAGYSEGFLYNISEEKRLEKDQFSKVLQNYWEIQYIGYDGTGTYNLSLDEGYELALIKRDKSDNTICLELSKDGDVVDKRDMQLLKPGFTIADQTYYYRRDVGPAEKIVTIAVHIQSIVAWDGGLWAIADGVWQISEALASEAPLTYSSGPPARLERTTIFGSLHVKELDLASEVIFAGPVVADRTQEGCVRFSYLPEGSKTPRRYRCLPDLALEIRAQELGTRLKDEERDEIKQRLQPGFTSVRYGDPGYAQLSLVCAKEIRTGAEDGSEMGAFCILKQPQREDNLRIRLEEYLPFGLDAGFIYIT